MVKIDKLLKNNEELKVKSCKIKYLNIPKARFSPWHLSFVKAHKEVVVHNHCVVSICVIRDAFLYLSSSKLVGLLTTHPSAIILFPSNINNHVHIMFSFSPNILQEFPMMTPQVCAQVGEYITTTITVKFFFECH